MTSFSSSNTFRVNNTSRANTSDVNSTSDVSSTSDVKSTFHLSSKAKILLGWSLGFALIVRLICSAIIPLTDTTEARYGEIARKMLETGDWITPQHDYGVPFWAKPPLSTWLSAISMKIFGVNEFAVRLPSLLLGIGILMLVWHWAKTQRNRDFALATCAVLASMSLFFMASGAVMTDESLTLCTTLAMISFWRAIQAHALNNELLQNRHSKSPSIKKPSAKNSSAKRWGYLFFVALGFGLLAKGLLVGVMTFLPILSWACLRNRGSNLRKNLLQLWRALPWVRGSILMLAISLPWYLIAEHKTPGFLAYFILGEHFGRFLNPGWSGDKYGNAHAETFGMIWVFLLISALPWSFIVIAKLKNLVKIPLKTTDIDRDWINYLLAWSFVPILFFTFAHNIIWTYPLPVLPALAVWIVEMLHRSNAKNPISARLAIGGFVTPLILLALAVLYADGYHSYLKSSQKDSVTYFLQHRPEADSGLYYFHHRYYSSEFYSAGKSKAIDLQNLSALFNNGHTDYLMISRRELNQLPQPMLDHFISAGNFGNFVMLREIGVPSLLSHASLLSQK